MRFIIPILLLAISAVAQPREVFNWWQQAAVPAAASCDTVSIAHTNASTGVFYNFGTFSTSSSGMATQFTNTTARTICKVTAYLAKAGTPTNNTLLYIFSDNAGAPGSELAAATAIAETSLSDSVEPITTTINYTLSANTAYWLVGKRDGYSSANYPRWDSTGTATVRHIQSWKASDDTWTVVHTTRSLRFILWE
jgi:hypothetical protein